MNLTWTQAVILTEIRTEHQKVFILKRSYIPTDLNEPMRSGSWMSGCKQTYIHVSLQPLASLWCHLPGKLCQCLCLTPTLLVGWHNLDRTGTDLTPSSFSVKRLSNEKEAEVERRCRREIVNYERNERKGWKTRGHIEPGQEGESELKRKKKKDRVSPDVVWKLERKRQRLING